MRTLLFLMAATLLASPAIAQTMSASPIPASTNVPAMSSPVDPAATAAPQNTATPAATSTPLSSRKVKLLRTGTLTIAQYAYAFTHQISTINQLRSLKSVNFDNVRIVHLPAALRTRFHIASAPQMVAYDPFWLQDAAAQEIAQANGSNSPIAVLQNVLANINVSNALNNVLNGTTLNANVSLADVLNNNKIAISQVLGVYYHGFSIINTIVK